MYNNGKDYSFEVFKNDPDRAFILVNGYRLGHVSKFDAGLFDVLDNEHNMEWEVTSPEEAVETIKIHYGPTSPKEYAYVPKDWKAPNWKKAGKVHEWKNYVNETLQSMWEEFTEYQKQALAASAEESASREEWD